MKFISERSKKEVITLALYSISYASFIAVQILLTPLWAKNLDPFEYSNILFFLATLNIVFAINALGTNAIIYKVKNLNTIKSLRYRVSSIYFFGLMTTIVFIILYFSFSYLKLIIGISVLNIDIKYIIIISVVGFAYTPYSIILTIYQRKRSLIKYIKIQLMLTITIIFLNLLLFVNNIINSDNVIFTYFIAYLIIGLFSHRLIYREIAYKFEVINNVTKNICLTGFKFMPHIVISSSVMFIERIIINDQLESTDLKIFGISYTYLSGLSLIGTIILQWLNPIIAEKINIRYFQDNLARTIIYSIIPLLIITFLYSLSIKKIILDNLLPFENLSIFTINLMALNFLFFIYIRILNSILYFTSNHGKLSNNTIFFTILHLSMLYVAARYGSITDVLAIYPAAALIQFITNYIYFVNVVINKK